MHANNSASAPSADSQWKLRLSDGVVIEATTQPHSPILRDFYAGYDRAFVLPDEKEDLDGFRACLALNSVYRQHYGRTHSELVATARDVASGVLLGGMNFLATGMHDVDGHPPVSVALNYVFVERDARGRGLSRALLGAVAQLANLAVGQDGRHHWPAIFIEQNDPLLMSPDACALDSAQSGVDQVDRLKIWHHLGAQLVDFPYVQPALEPGRLPDRTLAYATVQFPGATVSPAFLRGHLESFFGISVLKGRPLTSDAESTNQLATLDRMIADRRTIALMAMGPALAALSERANWSRAMALRDVSRSL